MSPALDLKPVYTIPQFAELFDCNPETVYKWIAAGKIKPIPLGRHMRINAQEVARIIEEGVPRRGGGA